MLVIGLTGGIASGKSTVSGKLAQLGAVIIDADKVAREVVEPGQPGLQRIVETFGQDILQKDGTLNRSALGALVFAHPEHKERLDRITLPLIDARIREQLAALRKRPDAARMVVVLDAALLLEAGFQGLVDTVWVVALPEKLQVERLMARDGFTREQALERLRSQMPLQDKLTLADQVIWNDGTVDETLKQVEQLWEQTPNMISE